MLPGFRFLFSTVVLAGAVLMFGLGAAALLRAAHEEFASLAVMACRSAAAPRPIAEAAPPTLGLLRVRRQDRTGCRTESHRGCHQRCAGRPRNARPLPPESPRRRSRKIAEGRRFGRDIGPSVVEASLPRSPRTTHRPRAASRCAPETTTASAPMRCGEPPASRAAARTVASLPTPTKVTAAAQRGRRLSPRRAGGCEEQPPPPPCRRRARAAPARSLEQQSRRPPIPSRSSSAARSPLSRPGRDRRTIGQAPFRPRAVVERAVDS